MLLRRITLHVREQNWTAVFIDFIIVVVGVFVGLQVQDWNEFRKDRIEEQQLLGRLLEDTELLIDANELEFRRFRFRADVLGGVNPILFSQAPSRVITDRECLEITFSHVQRRAADELPVLDEILETGRFSLLRDPGVGVSLRSYLLRRERSRAHYEEVVNELFRLHSRYPGLFFIRRIPVPTGSIAEWAALAGDGYQWMPECSVEEMRANRAFLNEYVDNLSRIESMGGYVSQRIDHLIDLKQMLTSAIQGS
ncbi:MAG: hypothetical protein V2I82_17285 [Halieaceae bacterium]|jgi:hypothetical protein|nr:hypothetical protein [Halieaceae bacterium]